MTNPLLNRTIVAVSLAADGGAIRFEMAECDPIVARADGDCCSHTWIENVDGAEAILGRPVLAVEDIPMPDLGSPDEYESIAYYGCKITTDGGECVIDYRNSSNGYYGGSLCWPPEYHYGGVYKQNVSKEEWRVLAGPAPAVQP